jgi:hypothetical protein
MDLIKPCFVFVSLPTVMIWNVPKKTTAVDLYHKCATTPLDTKCITSLIPLQESTISPISAAGALVALLIYFSLTLV